MTKTLKLLLKLLCDGNYHSGTDIGEKLKLTRSGIWKLIQKLRKLNIEINAIPNRGYIIKRPIELLSTKAIKKHISNKNKKCLEKIKIFDEIPSTNTYLMEQASKNKYFICLAESQTAGKGRLGRCWHSPFAQNIYLSTLWQFNKNIHELNGLSLVVALAIHDALQNYGIKQNIYLKWPNDVFWNNSKLAGILIEISGETHSSYNVVIGVGINVNMSSKADKKIGQPWIDIAQITNEIPQRNKLTGIVLEQLMNNVEAFQKHGFKPFVSRWLAQDITLNKKVTVTNPQGKIKGIGQGISEQGYFLLKDTNGKIQSFAVGEVSLHID
jgi:BirA family transcriptional regulator, biotin operon repressor / biotin---[acetyl-CoA-carboxylase] ligase